MKEFKIDQIWEGCSHNDQNITNWDYTVSFRINKIISDIAYGIVVFNNLYKGNGFGNVGSYYDLHKNYINSFNWRLKQDIIGEKCDRCDDFYNEAINNRGIYNKYFLCWNCEIEIKQKYEKY